VTEREVPPISGRIRKSIGVPDHHAKSDIIRFEHALPEPPLAIGRNRVATIAPFQGTKFLHDLRAFRPLSGPLELRHRAGLDIRVQQFRALCGQPVKDVYANGLDARPDMRPVSVALSSEFAPKVALAIKSKAKNSALSSAPNFFICMTRPRCSSQFVKTKLRSLLHLVQEVDSY
jgi:hypothetical protein